VNPYALLIVLIVGGVPMLAGLGLMGAAWAVHRRYVPRPQTAGFPRRARWSGFSLSLFVVGLLIFAPAGLYMALVLPNAFVTLGAFGFVPQLLLGGVPMVLGAALAYAGLKSRQQD
jgi:hypothetical protein